LLLLAALVSSIAAVHAETRVALVVGNAAYQHTSALANPGNDARDVGSALRAVGFDVTEAIDADKRAFERALRDFTEKLAKADVALLFYAGHGLQVGSENWLVPVDAKLERERDLAFEAVKLDFVLQQMEIDRQGKTTIVLLDACRDNPLAKNLARSMGTRSTSIGRGLASPPSTGLGTFIAYATQPGAVALDGTGARNSPFTSALLKQMSVPGRGLPATMIEVRKEVVAATSGRQVPWDHSALTREFQFVRGTASASAAAPATMGPAQGPDVAALEARLKQLEADARRRDEEARKSAAAPPPGDGKSPEDFALRGDNWLVGRRNFEHDSTPYDACRNQCDANPSCLGFDWFAGQSGGVCRNYDRIDRRESRPGWRSGVKADWAQRPAAGGESSKAGESQWKRSGFVGRLDQRIVGTQLPAPPSTANCESRCRIVEDCVAWSLSRQGACELFSEIAGLTEDREWRSGIASPLYNQRFAAKASSTDTPPIEPRSARPDGTTTGLTLDENVRIDGSRLGQPARAPSGNACRERCAETTGCIAFMHGKRIPDMGQCHLFDRIDRRQEDPAWRSGVSRSLSDPTSGSQVAPPGRKLDPN
jgi:uncharacterized caspase-like protein